MDAQKEVIESTELHIFIIWEYARHKQKEILHDISRSFTIQQVIEIQWSKDLFAQNLTRFYGVNLPKGSHKEQHVGTGSFLLIIVKDEKPAYDTHETSKGPLLVNTNTFLSKSSYRDLTGGGHRIHGTNSLVETNHDLTLMLGISVEDYLKKMSNQKPTSRIDKMNADLVGAQKWKSVEEIFYVLNNTSNYVVLRNFEAYPGAVYQPGHGDVDLLGEDAEGLAYILNAQKVFPEEYRVHYSASLGSDKILFDCRYVGDGYYDEAWQKDILRSSITQNGFRRPDNANYYPSVAYHALLHKPEFSEDYKLRLPAIAANAGIRIGQDDDAKTHIKNISNFMKKHNYHTAVPVDTSVYRNEQYFKALDKRLSRSPLQRLKTKLSPAKSK